MLPEWIPAYEQHERRMPAEAREKLQASARTLDRLLEPLRVQGARRSLTRYWARCCASRSRFEAACGMTAIPAGWKWTRWRCAGEAWLENLCGWLTGSITRRPGWRCGRCGGGGQSGTLAALQDVEASLPFSLLGLDSDNGGEFLNHHVLSWLQQRRRPVFMTRSRPYKKDDNAHVEQKNWTHIRQWFGYERHDNPEVVGLMNELAKGPTGSCATIFTRA